MKLFIKIIILSCFILQAGYLRAQSGVSINTDGSLADSKALLDVQSSSKGFLPPRLNTAQRTTLAASLTTSQEGMRVADSASGELYFWTGTQWSNASVLTGKFPVNVNAATNAISLNAGTQIGDLITWDGNNWISNQPAQKFSIVANNMQPYLAVNYFIAAYGIYPSQTDAQPFIGQICLAGFNFAPAGFLPCDGGLYSINDYTTLFTLIGTTYGGDGVNTFAVPDLRGRVPLHIGQGTGLSNYYLGQSAGTETSTFVH